MYRPQVLLGIGLSFLLGACDYSFTDPPEPTPTASADEFVARGIALALSSSALRAGLLTDMRDSKWTQHKLVLREYFKTLTGQRLATAAARESDVSLSVFLDSVAVLPDADLYVPSRADRMSWQGTADVLVASLLEHKLRQ